MLQENAATQAPLAPSRNQENEGFNRIGFLLKTINNINKLPVAFNIITERAKEEIHNIIVKSTESIRSKHPSLLKMATSLKNDNHFGLPRTGYTIDHFKGMLLGNIFEITVCYSVP